MSDKTVLITGANSGIGKATTEILADRGYHVVMLCRNMAKAEAVQKAILEKHSNSKIDLQEIDLTNFKSVRKAAEVLKTRYEKIDVLINNAGGIFKDRIESVEGMEMTFAMNHLGHFLLTNLLMDNIKEAPSARVINISSAAQKSGHINFDDLMAKTKFSPLKAYGQAKLANILFTKELENRKNGASISFFSAHPGVVKTNFGSDFKGIFKLLLNLMKPFMISPNKGAKTSVFLATEPKIEKLSGNYFTNCKIKKPIPEAEDPEVAKKLWEVSMKLVGLNP